MSCSQLMSLLSNHFGILHRAWQWNCHALCKIIKWFNNWNRHFVRMRISEIWVWYEFRRDILNFNVHIHTVSSSHDDVIKWKHFPRYWPFVQGIHQSPVNSPHKDQWCGALMFSLICAWINVWVNNCKAGDLRHHRTHYDVTVMSIIVHVAWQPSVGLLSWYPVM